MKVAKKIIGMFLFVGITPIVIVGIVSVLNLQNILVQQLITQKSDVVESASDAMNNLLESFKDDIVIIGELPPLQGVIRSTTNAGMDPIYGIPQAEWERRLSSIFAGMIEINRNIVQLRYIDASGKEIVRVESSESGSIITPKHKLQNKADRAYVSKTKRLAPSQVYISELNLNIENNQIEIPHKPVLRFATPVFSEDTGENKGLVIMNIDGNFILEVLEQYVQTADIIMIDEQGFFIFHPNQEKALSQYTGKEYNYFIEQPELIEHIYENNVKFHYDTQDKEYRAWKKIFYDTTNTEKYWMVFSINTEEEFLEPVQNLKNTFLIVFLASLMLIFVIAYLISKSITKPIVKLHKLALDIEKGNLKSRVQINSQDEFEEMAKSFNKAMEALEGVDEDHKKIDKAKTEFLSITSHELRSPMTPMQAQIQMLLKEYFGKLNEKQKEALKIIVRNTKRLDNIIKDFLEISRVEAGRLKFNFTKTDIIVHIKNIIKEMEEFLPEKNIDIQLKVENIPEFEVDSDRVGQIVRNLLNNAKKFSKDNATITVTVGLVNNMIQIAVADQGVGISEKDQLRIFEPFYQADNMYQHKSGGTGLGLAIIKGIVEAQSGKVWVKSTLGRGTTFYFTIPLTPVREARPIKLLFSERKDIEARVKEAYRNFLGPLGVPEFERIKNNLNEQVVLTAIKELHDAKIITDIQLAHFTNEIRSIFEGSQYQKHKDEGGQNDKQ